MQGVTIHPICVKYTHAVVERRSIMRQSEKKRVNIYLSEDTIERLKQYAWEQHTSVSHAITDWIWHTKVRNDQIRGQKKLKLE